MPTALTGKQRRALRALGHHLKPVVQVGQEDLTEGVVQAVDEQLVAHELIKVKIAEEDRDGRAESIKTLVNGTGSELAQTLGRTVLLFKKRKKKTKFGTL